jgi:hypothetical protein
MKIKLDDRSCRRQQMMTDPLAHFPEQQSRIELFRPWFSKRPSNTPCAQSIDHALQIAAGSRQVIFADVRDPGSQHHDGRGASLPQRASDVVDEVIEARMLLGLHFRAADEDGAEIGRKIAHQIRRR